MEQVWLGVTQMKNSVTKLIDSDNDGSVSLSVVLNPLFLHIVTCIVSTVVNDLLTEKSFFNNIDCAIII